MQPGGILMPENEAPLAQAGRAMADACERYFPDAFVFALGGVVLVFLAGLLAGESPLKLVTEFGDGFWVLVPFTRVRRRRIAAAGASHRVAGIHSKIPPGGRGPRCALRHADLSSLVGSFPDFHRASRA